MWCYCCTPEEQLEWKSEVKAVMRNIKEVERFGIKCIVNKQIGRTNFYVENDILDYFHRVDQGLLNLKQMALEFLATKSSFGQLQHVNRQNATRQVQHALWQQKQKRAEFMNRDLNNKQYDYVPEDELATEEDEDRTTGEENSEEILTVQNQLITNLNQKLSNCENEIEVLHSQLYNYQSRWNNQGLDTALDLQPSTSQTDEYPPEDQEQLVDANANDNSLFNNIYESVVPNVLGRVLNNFGESSLATSGAGETYKLLPVEKNPKKIKLGRKGGNIKKQEKSKNRDQATSIVMEQADKVEPKSGISGKISQKFAKFRNKTPSPEKKAKRGPESEKPKAKPAKSKKLSKEKTGNKEKAEQRKNKGKSA